jgi:hypothetical protein
MDQLARWLGLLISAPLMLVISAGCDVANISWAMVDLEHFDASEVLTQELPYSGQQIVLENLMGTVRVQGVEAAVRPVLSLEAVKKVRGVRLGEIQIFVEQSPREIRIRTDFPGTLRRSLNLFPPRIEDHVGWVEFTLKIPQDARLDLDQRLGRIEIAEFRGELKVSAQAGEISIRDSILTALALSSQAGSVSVMGVSTQELSISAQFGDLQLENSSFSSARLSAQAGSLGIVNNRGQKLAASTQAGDITILRSQLESVELTAQAGSIELAVTGLREGRIRVHFGDIHVKLPRAAPLNIQAQTQLGGIALQGLGLGSGSADVKWGGSWPGQTLTASLSGSQGGLQLSAQVGEIRVEFTP